MYFAIYSSDAVNRCCAGLLLACFTALVGCSTPAPVPKPQPTPKPVIEAAPATIKDEGGLYLLSVTMRNDLAPDYQPQALFIRIQKMRAAEKSELLRFNVLPTDAAAPGTRKAGTTYLLRLQLAPGEYRILGLNIAAGEFPVKGFGFMPIHADFTVPVGGNFYLGNVLGVIRQGQGDEYRIGPATPKADQSITGLADGTFDVTVQDLFEQELPLYRSRFPKIEGRLIDKALLPPIDRQRAQAYWEEQ